MRLGEEMVAGSAYTRPRRPKAWLSGELFRFLGQLLGKEAEHLIC